MSTTPDVSARSQAFLARYGATILRGGIAAIPTALFTYQAQLGLSAQEVWFTSYILARKWDEDLPHPSLVKMSSHTGMDLSQLHRIKASLVKKGMLEIIQRYKADRGQDSNSYDFGPLFGRLEELIRYYGPYGENLPSEGSTVVPLPPMDSRPHPLWTLIRTPLWTWQYSPLW